MRTRCPHCPCAPAVATVPICDPPKLIPKVLDVVFAFGPYTLETTATNVSHDAFGGSWAVDFPGGYPYVWHICGGIDITFESVGGGPITIILDCANNLSTQVLYFGGGLSNPGDYAVAADSINPLLGTFDLLDPATTPETLHCSGGDVTSEFTMTVSGPHV